MCVSQCRKKMGASLCVFISACIMLGSSSNGTTGEGLACDSDRNCRGTGSVCVQNKCGCRDGYIQDHALCIELPVVLGEKCNRSRDCAVAAGGLAVQCLHGVCECEYGYRPTPDRRGCIPQVLLGEECLAAEDCRSTSNNRSTECWRGVCSCPAGFRFTADRKDCVPAAIGDACQSSRDCHVTPNTRICDNSICKCSSLYVPSKQNNNTCLRVSNYNSFCEEDHQCVTNNTRCDVPKCACKKGYKWDASKCVNSEVKVISQLCLAAVLLMVPLKWL